MSKKILIGGGVALVALVVAVASMLLFAKVQPTEAEVRTAVELTLPDGAVVAVLASTDRRKRVQQGSRQRPRARRRNRPPR